MKIITGAFKWLASYFIYFKNIYLYYYIFYTSNTLLIRIFYLINISRRIEDGKFSWRKKKKKDRRK